MATAAAGPAAAVPASPLQIARDRYIQSLETDRERDVFKQAFQVNATAEDVLQTARASVLPSRKNDSKWIKAVDRTVDTMQELAPIFDIIASINSMVGCSIWGPLKLILMVRLLRQLEPESLLDQVY